VEIKHRSQFGELLAEHELLGHAAEVGVAEGRFSKEILSWGVSLLYLIDLWQHVEGMKAELGGWSNERHDKAYQGMLANTAGNDDRVAILRGWSHDMADRIPDGSLDFVYIDATHYYEFVMRDLECYWPKLRRGGIMAGHDYLNPTLTVKPAADEFARRFDTPIHTVPEDHDDNASFWFFKP
jgi:hypothetical protein